MKQKGTDPRSTKPIHSALTRPHRKPHTRILLYTGDVAVSTSPAVLETLLGSCVAVCLFDSKSHIGGMNHILLPACTDCGRDARFGVHAMELLLKQLMQVGVDRKSLVAKAFGGACVFKGMDMLKVGESNTAFVRNFLQRQRIPLVAQRLGGTHAVHVYFHTDTGKAIVRTVDGSTLPKIVHDEDAYRQVRYGEATQSGEATWL